MVKKVFKNLVMTETEDANDKSQNEAAIASWPRSSRARTASCLKLFWSCFKTRHAFFERGAKGAWRACEDKLQSPPAGGPAHSRRRLPPPSCS